MKSILGVYAPGTPADEEAKVHTPDPKAYHDAGSLSLATQQGRNLTSFLPGNHGYNAWRGVIIPHATRLGGSMGHSPEKKVTEVYIDPELTGRAIKVDMNKLANAGEGVVEGMLRQGYEQYGNDRDATVAAYAAFADGPIESRSQSIITIPQGQSQHHAEPERQAPLNMPGAYVVPAASPGGGQVRPASFTKQASPPMQPQVQPLPPMQSSPLPPAAPAPSLRSAFEQAPAPVPATPVYVPAQQAPVARSLRPVIFEMPKPIGRFNSSYHDVIKADGAIVLVYDNGSPMQTVWFPSPILDEQGQSQPIAMLVPGQPGKEGQLYLVHPTGVQIPFMNHVLCILTIEEERPAPAGFQG